MESVTGMMAWLSHVPGCSRAGLYGPANIDFRFVSKLRLQRAGRQVRFTPDPARLHGSKAYRLRGREFTWSLLSSATIALCSPATG